jgi:D-inositol-3-phosphate glycosyltransferase
MKIVLITPAHPLRGGIAASGERLAQALQEAGHTVVVYSFSLQYPTFLFPGKTQYTTDPAPADLNIKTCLNAINPFNWLAVGRAIARERPDRIICRFWLPFMGPCLGTVLRVARWLYPVRCTALVDNIIPHEKRFGDTLLARYFTGACSDFVVMARAVGTDLTRFTKHPVRYAPHPVYDIYGAPMDKIEAKKQLNLVPDVPIVLFFGFIRAYKGLDLLLEALADTTVRALGVQAVVAGEPYETLQPYEALVEQHHLQEVVHWHTDYIPSDAVTRYFSAADLVVQPYKNATQSGISQIAYHFEKPMVVTNVGGLPEIVADGVSGYVVPPAPADIAKAMVDFFKNDRAEVFRAGVRQAKQQFSWAYLAEVILND